MDNEDILNECLEAIARGETEESCLARYPEQASELRPLLRTVMAARKSCNSSPDPEYSIRARREYLSAVTEICAKKKQGFRWSWRWSTAAPLAIAVIMILNGVVVAASTRALPGQSLYRVKLAAEEMQIRLTSADRQRTKAYSLLSERRLEEVTVLAKRGNFDQVGEALIRLDGALSEVAGYLRTVRQNYPYPRCAQSPIGQIQVIPGADLDLINELQSNAARDKEKLLTLRDSMPENTQGMLEQVLESYNAILGIGFSSDAR